MKKWYQSKTVWFNTLAFVVAVAASFGFDGSLPMNLEVFVVPAVTVINLILRGVTTKKIVA
jgi:hypothetical protein